MSRIEKKMYQQQLLEDANSKEEVRLFAISNYIKSYPVVFSPQEPVIVLKSKRSATADQHPCAQWMPFGEQLYARNPCCHAMYVVDTTGLAPQLEVEEDASPILAGPLVKRATNVISRLNSRGATLVAAGPSALLAMKQVYLADRKINSRGEPLFSKLVIVCPKQVDSFKAIAQYTVKHCKDLHLCRVEVVVMLNEPSFVSQWSHFLGSAEAKAVFSSTSIVTKCSPLFEAIAAVCEEQDRSSEPHDEALQFTRSKTPFVYRIQFLLSRYTKQAEQEVELSPIETWGQQPEAADDEEESASSGDVGDLTDPDRNPADPPVMVTTSSQVVFLNELYHVKKTKFFVEGIVVDAVEGTVGNAHGIVKVDWTPATPDDDDVEAEVVVVTSDEHNGKQAIDLKKKRAAVLPSHAPPLSAFKSGDAVRMLATVYRNDEGMTSLSIDQDDAPHLRTMTPAEVKKSQYVCPLSDVPTFMPPLSSVEQSCGTILIRGRKCVLIRSLDGEFRGLRLPYQKHDDPSQSSMECAVDAVCMQCDISPDNFAIHPFVPPVSYYPTSNSCVIIYVAIATYEPPGGASRDAVEDEEDLNDPYDWLSYAAARQKLTTRAERDALDDLLRNIRRAADAGFYKVPHGLGLFGDEVAPAASPTQFGLRLAEGEPIRRVLVVHDGAQLSSNAIELLKATYALNFDLSGDFSSFCSWLSSHEASTAANGTVLLVAPRDYDLSQLCDDELPRIASTFALKTCFMEVIDIAATQDDNLFAPLSCGLPHQVHRLKALAAGAATADVIMLSTGRTEEVESSRRWVNTVRDFVRLVNKQSPIVVNDESTLLPESDASQSSLRTVTFEARLPFAPESIAALVAPNRKEFEEFFSLHPLVWVCGHVWLSTRFGYRGDISVSDEGASLALTQGDPWWCVVEEADRPEDCDVSSWDPKHGDRAQCITFAFYHEGEGVDGVEALQAAVDRLLKPRLCDAKEWRTWNRKKDPLEEWS